ncbi:nitroreductase family deazaflavin-dependent oxidoreductase [Pseudonocardia sp. GCM10023141]|uniref:nitroreductase family deazaflavin-dependent oxidoreductase n=1 Tax=Pseudonocardia sp. GCM10023141 TaxID=3252653 RepID=UPI0036191B71
MTTQIPASRSWRFARLTAPMARTFAGRRYFPLWAVVHHRGRVSGRALTVPVAVQTTPTAFVIALPWGPSTNWARNVLAAGGCVLRWRGADHPVSAPELLDAAAAQEHFSRFSWWMVQRVIRTDAFLLLHR